MRLLLLERVASRVWLTTRSEGRGIKVVVRRRVTRRMRSVEGRVDEMGEGRRRRRR